VTDDRTPPAEPRHKPMTVALAAVGALTAGLLAAWVASLPPDERPWNLSVIGALGLFAAARLGFWPAFAFVILAIGLKDAAFYFLGNMEPYPLSYLYFAGYAAIGWLLLRRTESPTRIGATALGTSMLFFLISNFVSWLEQARPYGYSLGGLMDSYAAGIPFYKGTFVGDLLFTGVLFGAHAVLSHAYFPAERVAVVEVIDPREHHS
jgi:hypothetical protein